ncbi:MAG: gas vesicle protein GvpJ [bacterium]
MPTLAKKHKEQNVALVDVVDRLLEKGAVVQGDVAIRLADVDLVYIGLRLMVTSISKAASLDSAKTQERKNAKINEELTPEDIVYLNKLEEAIKKAEAAIPKVIDGSDAEKIEQGITRLALTVVELLRRIMEREAVRQVKMNHLTTRETQKLGMALKALAKKMEEMRTIFGLKEEDLNLDLGPLGNLM